MATAKTNQSVIVVGAGLSGLVAAYELMQSGYQVTVLEAQSRAGGRVHTLRGPFADGMYVEAGAMSFPDTADQVMKYVRHFDLPIQTTADIRKPQPYFVFIRGQRIQVNPDNPNILFPVPLTPEEIKLGLQGMENKYLATSVKLIGDPHAAGWPPKELTPLDRMSVLQLAQSGGASEGAIELLRTTDMADLDGDGPTYLSALFMLRSRVLLQGMNEIYSIRGGNDLLPRSFATRLAHRICYGSPVFKIEQTGTGARASFHQGGSIRSLESNFLICAIPFTVLRTLEISPPFSADKQTIINELPSTSVTRIFWQFSRRFWEKEHLPAISRTDLPIMTVFPAYQRPGLRGVLESFTAGPTARTLGSMPESELLWYSLGELAKLYPEAPDFFEGGAIRNWDHDPWSRGAYAWYKPGQLTAFLPDLTRPEGPIHFAGDQTSDLPGWMQGALVAGQRAANEVMQRD